MKYYHKYYVGIPFALTVSMESNSSIQRNNILVIDPDKEFCKDVRLFLEENYNVFTRQGMEYIDYSILLNKINLIILEADNADYNLVHLIDKLRENHSNIKIIIMYTYFTADKTTERALARDADDMIAKPFDVCLLKNKVDRLLSGKLDFDSKKH